MTLPRPDGSYHPITTVGDLKDLCGVLQSYDIISIDTETTGLDYLSCDLVGVAITHKPGLGYYIPVKGDWAGIGSQLTLFQIIRNNITLEILLEHLNPILSSNKLKVLHNAKFDLHVLRRMGFTVSEPIYDTMVATQIISNCHGNRYGLKHLAQTKLGYDMTEFKEVAGKNPFYTVPIPEATDYACADVDLTLRLKDKLESVYIKFPELQKILELEMRITPILTDMEKEGCLIDVDYLKRVQKPLRHQLNKLDKQIQSELGTKFNVNSNEQLKEILENKLRVQLPNVDAKILKRYKERHPAIPLILDYRSRDKLEGTYVRGILERLDSENKIHTEFYQVLKTARLSSNNPNLQNLPTLKEDNPPDWPSIRRAIITPKGYKFVSIDYSQLELRIITHISQEPVWLRAFQEGKDIHSATASAVFGVEDVGKDQRKKAKTVNFGLLYGQSAYGLSSRMDMTVEEAEEFIKNYFSILPNVKDYMARIEYQVETQRYVENPLGRRIYFRYDRNDSIAKGAAIREAINFPVQSMAAEIVKASMKGVWDLLNSNGYKTKMILQVHDELDFYMPEDEVPILIPKIQNIMENIIPFSVELKTDCEIGDNWEDIKVWSPGT